MKVVLKLGGHLLFEKLDPTIMRKYVDLFKRIIRAGHQLVIIVGGGGLARQYIASARCFQVDEAHCDLLGIEASRLNARLLATALGDKAHRKIPHSLEEVVLACQSGRVVLSGGFAPGHSTVAVSALVAEAVGADLLIVATDVDGVYTADPRKDRRAKRLSEVALKHVRRIFYESAEKAGEYHLFDQVSLNVIERSKMRVVVLNGKDPNNILRCLRGEKVGTSIIAS